MTTRTQPSAIVGELSITTSTGAVLADRTDLGLAWKWAEHEILAAADPADTARWADMRYADQCEHVSAALKELRRACAATGAGETGA